MPVAVVVVLEPVHVPHDQGRKALFAAALPPGADLLADLFEEGIGPEQAGQSVVLDEVQLRHRDGDVLRQPREDLLVLPGESGPDGLPLRGLVVDLDDADDLLVVADGDGQKALQRGPEMLDVSAREAAVEGKLGDVDLPAVKGDGRGEVLGVEAGDVLQELGMGEEGVVPDQGLEVSAERLVLVQDVDRGPGRLDDVLELRDDIEEARNVVGLVDLAEDRLDPLPLLPEPDVLGLDGDPLLELLDEILVDEVLDLLDLGVDVPDPGLIEIERFPEGGDLRFHRDMGERPFERPRELGLVLDREGQGERVDVSVGRPIAGDGPEPRIVASGDDDGRSLAEQASSGRQLRGRSVEDGDQGVGSLRQGRGRFERGRDDGRSVRPAKPRQELGFERIRIQNEYRSRIHTPAPASYDPPPAAGPGDRPCPFP